MEPVSAIASIGATAAGGAEIGAVAGGLGVGGAEVTKGIAVAAEGVNATNEAVSAADAAGALEQVKESMSGATSVEDAIKKFTDKPAAEQVDELESMIGRDLTPAEIAEMPEAARAEVDTDLRADARPMEGLGLGASEATAETIAVDRSTVEASVRADLDSWDSNNEAPTDPTEYNQWCKDRVKAKAEFTVEAQVNHGLTQWERDNPQPDRLKEPAKFDQWVEDRTAQEAKLRETHTAESAEKTPGKTEDEKKPGEKLSAAEIKAKMDELKYLKAQSVDLADIIQALGTKPDRTPIDQRRLQNYSADKRVVDAQIRMLVRELKFYQKKAPLWQRVAIGAALATVVGGAFVAAAAKPAA